MVYHGEPIATFGYMVYNGEPWFVIDVPKLDSIMHNKTCNKTEKYNCTQQTRWHSIETTLGEWPVFFGYLLVEAE